MRGPNLLVAVVVQALAVAASIVAPGLARAQPSTCPAPGEEQATVVIDAPEAGRDVSGRVEVRGRAESPTALFQVELFVGDSRKDFVIVDPPVVATDFTLVWDTSTATGGPATLRVVACGGSADVGRLIRGSASVDVQVAAPAPAPPRTFVDAKDEGEEGRRAPSVVAGAVIAIPAAACLLFALGRRRQAS